MGEVWKARDSRLGREVAIKISAEQFSERFEREAQAIAGLNHSNICQLYDVGPNCARKLQHIMSQPIHQLITNPAAPSTTLEVSFEYVVSASLGDDPPVPTPPILSPHWSDQVSGQTDDAPRMLALP